MAIVRDQDNRNRAGMLRWGLIPVWAKDISIGYKMINARSETVHEKPAYKRLLKRRRCLIPASGFYEWKKNGSEKQPHHIQLKSEEPFAFAGLWDRWESEDGPVQSCTILTTQPNELMADIHNRMPVILTKDTEDAWLDRTNEDPEYLRSLLQPHEAGEMKAYEVSRAVGSPKNQGSDLIDPVS
ncbi:MAG TPA: SOS response-associated peptidase [Bacillales bacterium]|nr:SOS response-associated peptidase [Bacillales bacterium]